MENWLCTVVGNTLVVSQSDKRVLTPCNGPPFNFHIEEILIPPALLKLENLRQSQTMCSTRIRFGDSADASFARIGRVLTRAARKVILNGHDGSITVIPRGSDESVKPFAIPNSLVPLYDNPVVRDARVSLIPSANNRGLILKSSDMQTHLVRGEVLSGYLSRRT
jgi:hypothetical protein